MFLMFEALKWNLNPKSQIYNCTVLQNLGKPPKKKNIVRAMGGSKFWCVNLKKNFWGAN